MYYDCKRVLQKIPDDFEIKSLALRLLSESGKAELRARNMGIEDFLRYTCDYVTF